MALKKTIHHNGRAQVDAYCKIQSVWFDAKQGLEAAASAMVFIYPSREDSFFYDRCFHKVLVTFQYDLNSSLNVWTQAYDSAKQHHELIGAEDVFES